MMVGQFSRRTREYAGPAPCSVGIKLKKPSKFPADFLIVERRKQEDAREEMLKQTMLYQLNDLKTEWERSSDRRIMVKNINREVDGRLKINEFTVEDRRERLRELLRQEEQEYIAEMEAAEETVIERQAKMRERSKQLKERREAERLKVVQEKYDQLFREQCEELRTTLSKQEQNLVCAERFEQLKMKEEEAREKKAYENMYAYLWEKDRQEKMAREEREAKATYERNKDMLDVLRKQMAAVEASKEEAKRLQEEEAELMREQAALRKLEEEAAAQEKRRRQLENREMLDQTLKMKLRKRAREEQEQLAFDLKMLEELLEATHNEAKEEQLKKVQLREEDRRYREYLASLQEEEKRREYELQQIMQRELDAAWERRLNQWAAEKLIRRKLLEEVLAGRREQIKERLAENEKERAANQRERQTLLASIEENKRCDEEEAVKLMARHVQYQNDLREQIRYNEQLREERRNNEEYEYAMAKQAEREYQTRLKEALDNPTFSRLHPMRRALQSKQ